MDRTFSEPGARSPGGGSAVTKAGASRRATLGPVAWDDDEEWPKPGTDPESLERRREAARQIAAYRRRALRWAYAVLAVLIVVLILVVTLR
jgi:hypothetical protein